MRTTGILPLLLLLFAVAPAAMAQLVGLPEYGVLLSGTPDNPAVLNQSQHRILAFALRQRSGDQGLTTISNQVGLSQLTRGNGVRLGLVFHREGHLYRFRRWRHPRLGPLMDSERILG